MTTQPNMAPFDDDGGDFPPMIYLNERRGDQVQTVDSVTGAIVESSAITGVKAGGKRKKQERIQPNVGEAEKIEALPICPKCKQTLKDDETYGQLRKIDKKSGAPVYEYGPFGLRPVYEPCPTCSPGALYRRAARKQREGLDRMFGGSNIPAKMYGWSFESYPETGDQDAREFMEAYAEATVDNNVYLWGERGHTKTGLAVAAAHAFMLREESVLFLPSLQFYRLLRQEMFHTETNDRGEQKKIMYSTNIGGRHVNVLEMARQVKLLILDDVGAETPTAFVCSTLLELIEHRRNNGDLFTIFTSNKSIKELGRAFGAGARGGIDEDSPGYRFAERIYEDFRRFQVRGDKQRIAFDLDSDEEE